MVIEHALPAFSEWIAPALTFWLRVMLSLLLLGGGIGFLVAILRHGPRAAFGITARVLWQGVVDVVRMSPRRVLALAWLAVKESIRRRIVVVFAVFLVILLFAGWFLDPRSLDPARLYLGFVLTTTSYLVLLLVLFVSALSLPADFQTKTLYTVVTKPVRVSEIVLGRIVGFAAIGTVLLAVMGVVSYGFVVRGVGHSHALQASELTASAEAPEPGTLVGFTSQNRGHRHHVTVRPEGAVEVEEANGHTHRVTRSPSGGEVQYQVGGPEGTLLARVPVYGKIRFRDRDKLDSATGMSVGDEWFYRSYIPGGTLAAAIWTFDGVTPERFPEELPVEMNISVFRTYKGKIEKGVFGSLALRNPKTGLTVVTDIFESKEFRALQIRVPRKINSFSGVPQLLQQRIRQRDGNELLIPATEELKAELAQKKAFDLYEDLVADGKVEVWLQCLEPAQYFGAAQADLYLRAPDSSFVLNFAKGYVGIWFQMVLIVGFGVMFSTFLSGPVAMLATLGVLVSGMFIDFMFDLALGKTVGGGPLESLVRLVTQQNVVIEMDPGVRTYVVQMVDFVLRGFLYVCTSILPPFGQFDCTDYVASGFEVSGTWIMIRLLTVLGYLLPVFLVGYFFLKTREVAR